VRDRLLAIDGIVVGSPVYAGRPMARMKTLMDRLTLLIRYAGTFDDRHSGVATSGIAPVGGVAREAAGAFVRVTSAIGAKTASATSSIPGLLHIDDRRLPDGARSLGRRLVRDVEGYGERLSTRLQGRWYSFLRRRMLRRFIVSNAERFAGVVFIWRQKGWL